MYCDSFQKSSPFELRDVAIAASTNLARALGGYGETERHIQEIHIGKMLSIRQYLGEQRRIFPAIAEQFGDISRLGHIPPFAVVDSVGRELGAPRRRKQS